MKGPETRWLIRKIAKSFRYVEVDELIGVRVEMMNFDEPLDTISASVLARIPRFNISNSPDDDQRILPYMFAKYGFLDVMYEVQSVTADSVPLGGISLLQKLGFVFHQAELPEPLGGVDEEGLDPAYFLIDLSKETCESKLYLKVWLSNPETMINNQLVPIERPLFRENVIEVVDGIPQFERLSPWSEFPVFLTISDACVTNAPSAWLNRHFYL